MCTIASLPSGTGARARGSVDVGLLLALTVLPSAGSDEDTADDEGTAVDEETAEEAGGPVVVGVAESMVAMEEESSSPAMDPDSVG